MGNKRCENNCFIVVFNGKSELFLYKTNKVIGRFFNNNIHSTHTVEIIRLLDAIERSVVFYEL